LSTHFLTLTQNHKQFGSVPDDAELQGGLAAFFNELYKALKLNTVGGDSVIEAVGVCV